MQKQCFTDLDKSELKSNGLTVLRLNHTKSGRMWPQKQLPHYYNQALFFDTNSIFKQLWSDSKRLKLECLTEKRQSDDCPYKS